MELKDFENQKEEEIEEVGCVSCLGCVTFSQIYEWL